MHTAEEYLQALEEELVNRGYPKMNTQTLAEAYKRIQDKRVMEALNNGQLTIQQLSDHIDQSILVSRRGKLTSDVMTGSVTDATHSLLEGDVTLSNDATAKNPIMRQTKPFSPQDLEQNVMNPVVRNRKLRSAVTGAF